MSSTEIESVYERYRKLTREAINRIEIVIPEDTWLYNVARHLLDMAERYLVDSEYFFEKGDAIRALIAVVYAHAWLDVGVRMGILKGNDPKLFMVEP